ncbi:hypothetical protein MPER_05516 [Moniliophthora perniciosa FA553]|nr:hypothetical protein MPER_05516 [Moniliophthora perniciosa FA553]
MDIHALETMSVPLTYSIDDSIPPSGRYVAENVLIDKPTDQNSRWSTSNTNQWITLRLQSLAIHNIRKTHPCTMKDFKIYVGMRRDQMVEVLHASLKNDTIPEAFSLKHKDNSGLLFPTRFIKIVPLSCVRYAIFFRVDISDRMDPQSTRDKF